jgi:small GTP-binding protein
MSSKYDYLFKIICVGDYRVGKTSVLTRFTDDIYTEKYNYTIGIDSSIKSMKLFGKTIQIQLLDTPGRDRHGGVLEINCERSDGIIFSYSCDDWQSFKYICSWAKCFKSYLDKDLPIILIGNKSESDSRRISWDEGQSLANELGVPFLETSAKLGININEIFEVLCRMIIGRERITDRRKIDFS